MRNGEIIFTQLGKNSLNPRLPKPTNRKIPDLMPIGMTSIDQSNLKDENYKNAKKNGSKKNNEFDFFTVKSSHENDIIELDSGSDDDIIKKNKLNLRDKNLNINYPPPLPITPQYMDQPNWKSLPSNPLLNINIIDSIVELEWTMKSSYPTAQVASFELYLCKETNEPPKENMWIKLGECKIEKYPMVRNLTDCSIGSYWIALRAIDVHDRRAPFSIHKFHFPSY
ncbi:uncharacterized protein LOC126898282 [Daktulosphaira vitifoliae]|uniref:uncharacterized protein LOC126898282 n=1 Tax=Daktulosphaira vitifoliae TaxID=58002 RepID=UPI0021AAA461|nr:uncharacterized protein LOC126898282 [Daktulosphaira vitifoliae]